MYVTMHKGEVEDHVHLTLEHGPHAGTWEVRFEQGAVWRIRSPHGRVQALKGSEPWMGDLGHEFADLMRRIAPRAVTEAIRREKPVAEEARAEAVAA